MRPHTVAVGLLRNLRVPRNRAAAQAAVAADERAIRAIADQHRWRVVTVLGPLDLTPETDKMTDPIEHLLKVVRKRRADAVVVPDRRYLTDLQGHDCLEMVCRACFVVTMSPQQLWACSASVAAVPTRSLP
ncbi:hypothetical protein [Nocardia pseudovaccinii]|uniref:hypothetical protein n=1 Tax=Nocardia pseudovaccinii TaxID=189540 RepID=UPI0012F4DC8A|nr:hypothetical protein [Nocardia pseudovaccinii]